MSPMCHHNVRRNIDYETRKGTRLAAVFSLIALVSCMSVHLLYCSNVCNLLLASIMMRRQLHKPANSL